MRRFGNNVKTAVLLAGLFAIVLAVGSIWGQQGLIFAFIFGGMMNVIAYFFSDKIALATTQAQEVDEKTAPDLVTMVRRLADNAGLPMPRVYICPQEAPNAFATGRNPRHAAVAVTHGALKLLTYEELEGVMAHELSHVKNRDTLTSCIAATIAGALNMLGWMAYMGGGSRNSRDVNPLVMLAMIILAPIAAAIIQMAISRSREYVADHDAAYLAGTPQGLISALRKLDAYAQRIPFPVPATQNHMFIIKPLSGRRRPGDSLFATHPSTENRIRQLQEIGAAMGVAA